MIRRSLCACLGAAALVGALVVPAHVVAKPPDLPMNETITVTPQAESLYEALPESVPTPTLYQLRPTARRTLVGSILCGINPLLALLPMEEVLDAPHDHPQRVAGDDGVTCPYLRQQRTDHHACQYADPEIGRDVLDNLKRLKQADDLIETAKALAEKGNFDEAIKCCFRAQLLCPGSPSADRAVNLMFDLNLVRVFGCSQTEMEGEEAAEDQPETPSDSQAPGESDWWKKSLRYSSSYDAGVEVEVRALMKACHLLMNEGLPRQAAELARQAYALDPQRVRADPLIYKMHLLAESPSSHESSEDCEPPSCPYCPSSGKPIRRVLTEQAGAEEASEEETSSDFQQWIETMIDGVGVDGDGGLRLSGAWSCGDNVYHLRYHRGSLAIWTTPDAAKGKP